MRNGFFYCLRMTIDLVVVVFVATSVARAKDDVKVERSIVFAEVGTSKLRADVYHPRGDGPFPGVLVIHGGAWISGDKSHMDFICRRLAAKGYVAATVNYRLAPKHRCPAQIEDCEEALRWFHRKAEDYKIDPARVATFGYSAGAHLSLMLAVRPVMGDDGKTPLPPVKAVVAGGAPCDFRIIPKNSGMLAFWFGGTRAQKEQLYCDASPAAFFSESTPPVFFYNGDEDDLVDIREVRVAHRALEKLGVDTALHVIPGGGHIGVFFSPAPVGEAIKFLDARLKK